MLVQQLINGLSIGSIYALMAVGYSLIYSLLGFTTFAHSATVIMGAYMGFFMLSKISLNISLALMGAIILASMLGIFIEITTYRPLLNKNAKKIYLLIAGLGISTIGENIVIATVGGQYMPFPQIFPIQPIKIFGATVGVVDIIILAASVFALILVEILISRTKIGLAIRGASYRLEATAIMGINVNKLIIFVFALAGSLAGLAGFFLGVKYTAYPQLGSMTTKAFISAVFGGLGSVKGAMLGALILGIIETLVSAYISSQMRDIFAFALLVIVLLIRPTGIMGKINEDKA